MTKILIIGQHGQVSSYLQRELSETKDYELVVAGRDTLDLTKLDHIQAALKAIQADIIINPAAHTAVDLAEEEIEAAQKINHLAVAQIAEFCANSKTPLIHYSTDYVFDGESQRPYLESDRASPNSVYGKTKYDGEQAILATAAPAIILRTSWVYSNQGKNFYKTMLALAETRSELTVVADQMGSPTSAKSIAEATGKLVDTIVAEGEIGTSQTGIYHFTCAGETSWCEFAKAIFELHEIETITVLPITTEQYPTPAKRPSYSVLNNDKLFDTFGIRLPDWQDALVVCVAETKSDNP